MPFYYKHFPEISYYYYYLKEYFVYLPENKFLIWSTPTLLWTADYIWPNTDAHSPALSRLASMGAAKLVNKDIQPVIYLIGE